MKKERDKNTQRKHVKKGNCTSDGIEKNRKLDTGLKVVLILVISKFNIRRISDYLRIPT